MTPRWDKMRYHSEQARLSTSPARFNVVPAGRRSGKTEIVGKRKLVLRAINAHDKRSPYYRKFRDPRFGVCAPTRDQVKRIYWRDLKELTPQWMIKNINESQLSIDIINGAELWCLGMDKPERIEGVPWDHLVLDEYANMKKKTWGEHVRAALSDRQGSCDFIGVPEGRNHYYDLYKKAQGRKTKADRDRIKSEWDTFWWPSADILPKEEIEAAREDLDELTFQQEYEASFINFTGRAYWAFLEQTHTNKLTYDPKAPLIFCFDFNVAPGVAAIVQEQMMPKTGIWGSGVIGEVYIPRGSNTILVCNRLIKDWGGHKGKVFCYGDATGGAGGTAKVMGSDWQLIKEKLWPKFGDRIFFRVPLSNPRERQRINAVNSRLLSVDGKIRMVVDPSRAPYTIRDLEGVVLVEGGSGEINKKSDPDLTHLTDAIGYYAHREYPVTKKYRKSKQKHWK